jgi:hypothetical protein
MRSPRRRRVLNLPGICSTDPSFRVIWAFPAAPSDPPERPHGPRVRRSASSVTSQSASTSISRMIPSPPRNFPCAHAGDKRIRALRLECSANWSCGYARRKRLACRDARPCRRRRFRSRRRACRGSHSTKTALSGPPSLDQPPWNRLRQWSGCSWCRRRRQECDRGLPGRGRAAAHRRCAGKSPHCRRLRLPAGAH